MRTLFIKIFNFRSAPEMLFKENVSVQSSSLRGACADAVAAINDHE